jgi:hypothetical protein
MVAVRYGDWKRRENTKRTKDGGTGLKSTGIPAIDSVEKEIRLSIPNSRTAS